MSTPKWKAALKKQQSAASLAWRVRAIRRALKKHGAWIERYRGGLPAGVFAAFASYESNWEADAPGDKYLGEIGYYQITKTLPGHFNLPAKLRYNHEGNVFLGGLEYNEEAAKFSLLYPQIKLGTADSWKIARLVFAVGRGGTRRLLNGAKPLTPGNVYGSLLEYIDRIGGVDLGRGQPAPKVWFRVHMVPVAWDVGQKALAGKAGYPEIIPTPPGVGNYKLKASIKDVMRAPRFTSGAQKGIGSGLFKLGLAMGLGLVTWKIFK